MKKKVSLFYNRNPAKKKTPKKNPVFEELNQVGGVREIQRSSGNMVWCFFKSEKEKKKKPRSTPPLVPYSHHHQRLQDYNATSSA